MAARTRAITSTKSCAGRGRLKSHSAVIAPTAGARVGLILTARVVTSCAVKEPRDEAVFDATGVNRPQAGVFIERPPSVREDATSLELLC
jgi:hypothetical protein